MSISILILSLVFALIEAGLAWTIIACQPVAALVEGVPAWLLTGGVFALGMLLSFVVIIVIGLLQIGPRAATFVRSHFGRTLALGFLCIVLVFALAAGGEVLYHVAPRAQVETVTVQQNADVCFVLDYSSSMKSNNAEINMKAAFEQVINNLPDGQRVCVVGYDGSAYTLQTWTELDAATRTNVIFSVKNRDANGDSTNFTAALREADKHAQQAVNERRACAVIMLSDGDCPMPPVATAVPGLINNHIPVFTMYTGNHSGASMSSLQAIANETGGEMRVSAADLTNLSVNLTEVTQKAAQAQQTVNEDHIPDTLLTEADAGRTGILDLKLLRAIVLFVLCFIFKLICVICVGNNSRFLGHFLHALVAAALAVVALVGCVDNGISLFAAMALFWVITMVQFVKTK